MGVIHSLGLTSWYVLTTLQYGWDTCQVLSKNFFPVLNRTYVRTNYIGVVRTVYESATIQKKLRIRCPLHEVGCPLPRSAATPCKSRIYRGFMTSFPIPLRFFGVVARPGKNPAR